MLKNVVMHLVLLFIQALISAVADARFQKESPFYRLLERVGVKLGSMKWSPYLQTHSLTTGQGSEEAGKQGMGHF